MTLRLDTVTIDAHDPRALARWWAEVLDYEVGGDEPDEVWIQPKDGAHGSDVPVRR